MTRLLRLGASGDDVEELQRRLIAAGFAIEAPLGTYTASTELAVRTFQRERLLACDGLCGPDTWEALVERGHTLGDRHLYLRRPMLRGDDIAELQARLNGLGFDAGRDDGIFGPQTERGLREFQRNAALSVDGQCGPTTLSGLRRLSALSAGSLSSIREREALTLAPSAPRLVIAVAPELAALAPILQRNLATVTDAQVIDTAGSDDRIVAQHANRLGAELFLGFRVGDDDARVHYFGTPTTCSERGKRVAGVLATAVASVLDPDAFPIGARRTAVLRETAMPAVVCYLAHEGAALEMRRVVQAAPSLAIAVTAALRNLWATARSANPPVDDRRS